MSNVHMNLVTWSLALLPENATKIDQINQIILGSSSSANAPIEKAKNEVEKPVEKKIEEAVNDAETSGVSQADLQTAAKAAKKAHDVDFLKECIAAAGGEVKGAIGKSLSSIPVEQHDEFLELLKAGPVKEETADDDDGFGDDLGDDLGDGVPEVSAVKAALKAYAKDTGREEAKAIMNKHGAEKLQNVDDCTPKQLIAMFAELV